MAISRKDCKLVRAVVNRAALGPAWFNEDASSPLLSAMIAELRSQTREWLQANIIRELNYMMPPDERVKLTAHTAMQQPQVHRSTPEAIAAARAMQAQIQHQASGAATSQAEALAVSASPQCSAEQSVPAQAQDAVPLCSQCKSPLRRTPAGFWHCGCPVP